MTLTTSDSGIYYDPYDFEIDADPYPVWRRLRDEAPLYYNEKYDFYALSRFDDVERGADRLGDLPLRARLDPRAHQGEHRDTAGPRSSSRTRPIHDVHRGLLSRVFTPRKMNAIEPKVREFCARCARPARRRRRLRLRHATSVRRCRCGRSACCSASRSRTRKRSATASTTACDSRTDGPRSAAYADAIGRAERMFADYIDWRAEHPSDDLMTELLTCRVRGRARRDPPRSPAKRFSPTSTCSPAPATRPRPD